MTLNKSKMTDLKQVFSAYAKNFELNLTVCLKKINFP